MFADLSEFERHVNIEERRQTKKVVQMSWSDKDKGKFNSRPSMSIHILNPVTQKSVR